MSKSSTFTLLECYEKIYKKNSIICYMPTLPHRTPSDLGAVLKSNTDLKHIWNTLTPLSKNEWICWITSAVKPETRLRRIRIASESLAKGKRRPCCWAGCPHR